MWKKYDVTRSNYQIKKTRLRLALDSIDNWDLKEIPKYSQNNTSNQMGSEQMRPKQNDKCVVVARTRHKLFWHKSSNAVSAAPTGVSWIITKPHLTWIRVICLLAALSIRRPSLLSWNNIVYLNVQDQELYTINCCPFSICPCEFHM